MSGEQNSFQAPKPSEVIELLKVCGKLKRTARTGWVRKGVQNYESVAEHSWRITLLPMFLSNRNDVDHVRCMKIGLVHDLAEALVGDITPHCGVSDQEKFKLESEAMSKIKSLVPGSRIGEEIVELWNEYEAGETKEAKVVKDFDKFEMILQAEEYEAEQGVDLSEFFESTKGKIRHGEIKTWEEELRKSRDIRRGETEK
ncbi:hypothetical protein GUITHDRAFT_109150 [Guillardia theta CCMP2712]|uniref:5'-deoxynucleotidase n=2 Tax=Guillardia theta TaxID=55529 RepID=L1J999_GUITC|nr:hypothetical protein GUITHDRAFT_109150 [Guillardia theta CCMP2712]EKX45106.1 hypothetical protein GUITHDRAFT_109150 [Guillardia theta CCMP2712]|eukprot:XP_005832086.1 hypothetical protein GUITHDRAFT_109150 [Guillardia theta CCMP2712]